MRNQGTYFLHITSYHIISYHIVSPHCVLSSLVSRTVLIPLSVITAADTSAAIYFLLHLNWSVHLLIRTQLYASYLNSIQLTSLQLTSPHHSILKPTHSIVSQKHTTPHQSKHYTTLHYTTLHYTTLHYTTLHYIKLNTAPHRTTPHYNTHLCGLRDLRAWRHTELPALRLKKSARTSDINFVSSTTGRVTATRASSKKVKNKK